MSGWDLVGFDLGGTNLRGANLSGSNLVRATLADADLSQADLYQADCTEADFTGSNMAGCSLSSSILRRSVLRHANLHDADLEGVFFCDADCSEANLFGASLRDARLQGVDLELTNLVSADVVGATLSDCRVFGVAAWDLKGRPARQERLRISRHDEPLITTDDLEIAQFLYLMLYNERVGRVVDSVATKLVLILGRFGTGRKEVLETLREEVQKRDRIGVIFDFEAPDHRDLSETASLLAHMAYYVIADLSDARSVPHELMAVVPHLPSVPVQPIIAEDQQPYSLFEHLERYPWVLDMVTYSTVDDLRAKIGPQIIEPAEAAAANTA